MDSGTLYVVATPIGNLEDMSPRALKVLSSVDLIAAEDTRHTGRLLSRFGIAAKQVSLHEHNEERAAGKLVTALKAGQSVALVSDAGTPLVSDPGFRLVRAAHEASIPVCPLPGPSAAIAAMSVAGVPSDRFLFAGFLPVRRDARRRELQRLSALPTTMVFFESVHRIRDSLCDMRDCLGGDRAAFLAREISKLNEQYIHANLDALCDAIEDGSIPAKGEFVVVIAGSDQPPEREAGLDSEVLLRELLEHMSGKEAVEITCRVTGRPRNEVYREMLALRADD